MSPSLTEQLHASLAGPYQQIGNLPFTKALLTGDLPVQSFLTHLRCQAAIWAFFERELPANETLPLRRIWQGHPPSLTLVLEDLAEISPSPTPDVTTAVRATLSCLMDLRALFRTNPLSLLGPLWVVESLAQDDRAQARDMARVPGTPKEGGLYYQALALGDERYWDNFERDLNDLYLSKRQREAIWGGAREMLFRLTAVRAALFPFKSNELAYSALALNPEADDHPVPQDPVRLKAARSAARRSQATLPYLAWLYQKQGERFADSDCAWLATLAELPPAKLPAQLDRLAGALAARGIPSYGLQRQLELVYEELYPTQPDWPGAFRSLLLAARELATRAESLLPLAARQELLEEFARKAPTDELAQNPGCAQMAISWVLDLAGNPAQKNDSLPQWFLDAGRFSRRWLKAAQGLLSHTASLTARPAAAK